MPTLTLIEAVTLALDHEMARDKEVVILGEDVGRNGGVFRATDGLQEKYGDERVLDTPLAEAMIAGLSVGMAAQGMRPVAEIQFMGFVLPALNQLLSAAARMRNRTRGRLHLPMVVRMPYGGSGEPTTCACWRNAVATCNVRSTASARSWRLPARVSGVSTTRR